MWQEVLVLLQRKACRLPNHGDKSKTEEQIASEVRSAAAVAGALAVIDELFFELRKQKD